MRIFLYVTGILVLLLMPFFVKAGAGNKIFLSFFLGFVAITFLINILLVFLPGYIYIFYSKYKAKKLQS